MKNWLVLSALVFSSVAASAQCRAGRVTVSEELREPGATIVATVEDAQPVPDSSFHLDGINYVVRVDRVLRGKLMERSSVKIFSENSPERFPMQVGKRYLLFVHMDYDRYAIDNCGNSGLLNASGIDTLQQLKQLAKK